MSGYRIVVWSGPDIARNVVGRAKALTIAQEQARARGRTTAVYPEGENGVSGDRVARCDPDGSMEVYGPEHWQEGKPATMGAQRAKPAKLCGICRRPLDQPGDELSLDCGGDCWGCIREAEAM